MLKGLALSNWKSFGDGDANSELTFGRTTLLVGPNGSGKSNVLDALRALQGAALDLPFAEVLRGRWEGGRQVWGGVRGAEGEAANVGHSEFSIGSRWTVSGSEVSHFLTVSTAPEVQLVWEALFEDQARVAYWFDTNAPTLGASGGPQPGGGIKVGLRSLGGGRNLSLVLSAARSLLGQVEPVDRVDPAVIARSRAVRQAMRDIMHLEIQPERMRGPAPLHATRMGSAGDNVAAVLHSMHEGMRSDLVDWLSELCAPRVEGLHFEVVEAVREVYFFVEEGAGRRVSSRSLSDGTLRFLGILVGLLTAPPDSLVLLEEPDVGLHPARVHLLAQILEEIPKRRSIQVIATTHSPILLAHLSDTLLADTLAFDREQQTGFTLGRRLGDLRSFDTLRDSRHRDHLVSTGWLERAA